MTTRIKRWNNNIYVALIKNLLIAMLLFSICRVAFYLFNQNSFPNMNAERFGIILLGGLKFDLSAVLYMNILYILMLLIPFKFKYGKGYLKVAKYVFFVTNGIALFANLSDIIYYRFTFRRTTSSVFNEFGNNDNIFTLYMRFFIDYWYIVVFGLFMITLMVFLYKQVKVNESGKNYRAVIFYPLQILLLLGFAYLIVGGFRGGFKHSTRPITLADAGKYATEIDDINLVLNTPFAIIRTIKRPTLKRVEHFTDSELSQIYSPIHSPKNEGDFKKKNVVVFILESFGKEYFGVFNKELENGNYKGYTPFLDSLVSESLTFKYSFANGGKSIDAMPSVLASIPSVKVPFVLSNYSGNKINSLANLLTEKDYETAFFHGAPNGSMGFDSFAKMAGFDNYQGYDEYGNEEDFDGWWGIWDDKFFQFYANEMSEMKQPFFTSLFSVSSHHPFQVPKEFEGKFPKGELPMHQCVGYTDYALRKFFETSKQTDWYENTIFVITADHTNQTNHKKYQTLAGATEIPIIFFEPNSTDSTKLGGLSEVNAQQMDIMPTILDYLNFDKPYFSFGKSLLDSTAKNTVLNYRGNHYQFFMDSLVLQSDGSKTTGLYKFKTDELLKNNLVGKMPKQEEVLMMNLKAFIQQYINRMLDDSLRVVD
ncbi:MAG: phosphoglycerol transferase MdoB-like AlkP superfamily enzyme [Arenicella sp.]|jgi:phosphoglycerol transferase MdoB-like AlkP superfamily enzyme